MSHENVAVRAKTGLLSVKNVVLIGMFGALAAVVMMIEFPLPMIAPAFYELDLSEVPALVGTFAIGPVAGVMIEAVKILVKLLLKPTSTAYVGELANFCIGCAYLLPAGLIYMRNKSKKSALTGMVVGTIIMTVAGCLINAYVLLPFYSRFYGMPMETLIGMGAAISPAIGNVLTFVIIAVAPFNIIKGILISAVTLMIYKRISVILKAH